MKRNDVARHDIGHRNLDFDAATDHVAVCLNHGIEFFDGLARLTFLIIRESHGDHHHESDNCCGSSITCSQGDCRDHEELDDKGVLTSVENLNEETIFLFLSEIIRTPSLPADLHFHDREPLFVTFHGCHSLLVGLTADLQQSRLVLGDGFGRCCFCLRQTG